MKLNNIDLNKLNTFLTVAECGGVTVAAKKLMRTRSAISQSISNLEAALETKLFSRVGRKLVLNEQGRRLYESFSAYQRQLSESIQSIVGVGRGANPFSLAGEIRIGLFVGFPRSRLTAVVSEFLNEYSETKITFRFAPASELTDLLAEGKIDFAFSVESLESRENKLLSSQVLFEEELVLVCGKKLYSRVKRVGAREILELPVISYYRSSELFKRWYEFHFGKPPGAYQVRAYCMATDFVLDFALNNVGIGILPGYVAEPYLKRRQLIGIRPGRREMKDYIWISSLRSQVRDPLMSLFLRKMSGHFRKPAEGSGPVLRSASLAR